MKAFLLSAGRAERLRPLTETIPKCLVKIQQVPLLAIWLEICRRSGITEALINLHWQPEAVLQFLRTFQTPVRISTVFEPELLGSAGTVRKNWHWVRDEEQFWVIYTDVLTTADLRRIAKASSSHNGILTLVVNQVEDPSGCGLATLDEDGRVQLFEEKPARPASNLAFSGFFLARRNLIDHLPSQAFLDFGLHVFPRLGGKMRAYLIKDYCTDIGTPERLASAQQNWPGLPKEGV